MYNKLFTKILDSSIWLAPDPHRIVWITFLAAMDEDGNAMFASAANVAVRARVTREQAEAAIASFEAPDPDSGDPENEGRRIERFPGGWHVLNAHKYRALVTKAIIREQTRVRVARHREKTNGAVTQEKREANAHVTTSVSRALATATATSEVSTAPQATLVVAPGSSPRTPRKKSEPATSEAWSAYASAYESRYGAAPVRNAKVNGMFANLVSRLGADEAPGVARFYLGHRHSLYVSARHCVDLLLRDCERLRTEWVTGEQGTATEARLSDRAQNTSNSFAPLIAAARAREMQDAERSGS